MENQKTWTILICCYNSAKTICAALDSIGYKDNNDIDVFVVDDGSSDNLKNVVAPYVKAYPNVIHYFRKENGNQGSCINFAIQKANSKYFSLLDSDDTFNPRSFNAVLGYLRSLDNVDLIINNYRFYFIKENKTKIEKLLISKTYKPVKFVDINNLSLFSLITIHSTIYRTDILRQIQPLPEKMGFSDCVLYYEVLLKIKNIAYLNRSIALYNYHIRRGKQLISLNNSIRRFYDFIKILDVMLSIPLDKGHRKHMQISKKIISHHIYWICMVLANIYTMGKEQKKELLNDIFKKVDNCEELNEVRNQLYTPLMCLGKYFPIFTLKLIKFMHAWIPVKMIKATRYSKEGRREARQQARLEKQRAKEAKKNKNNHA